MPVIRFTAARPAAADAEARRLLRGLHRPVPTARAVPRAFPPVNLYERPGEFLLVAPLPGVPRDAVEVTVEGDRLRLAGRRETADLRPGDRRERVRGPFERWLPLPAGVRAEALSASLKDGLLRVRLPKLTPSPGRAIPVTAGGAGRGGGGSDR